MPTVLDSETIKEAQERELGGDPQKIASLSLNLQHLNVNGHRILCDISAGFVRPYLPQELRHKAFDVIHAPAHPSGRVTSRMLKEKYVWPGVKKDALKWARECPACQRAKVHRQVRTPPTNIDVPDQRFNHTHLDIIVLPLVDGYRYCLTMIDRFSRWSHVVPLKDIFAETIARAFYEHWISMFGTPLTITTDQGPQFESALFSALARLAGAEKIRTTPYHPQSNGMLERWHRTLKAALMCHPETPWTQLLPTVLLGLRTAYKEDLHASPAELMFGTSLRVPGDLFSTYDGPADPHTFIGKHQTHFRLPRSTPTAHHIKAKHFVHKELSSCTHVFRRVDAVKPPLTPPYTGPHRVLQRLDQKRYVIDINGEPRTVSTEVLKPAFIEVDDPSVQPRQPPVQQTRPSVSFQIPVNVHQPSTPTSSCPPNSSATRGGVAVAPLLAAPKPARPAASTEQSCRQPRKQKIVPRPLFSVASAPVSAQRPCV